MKNQSICQTGILNQWQNIAFMTNDRHIYSSYTTFGKQVKHFSLTKIIIWSFTWYKSPCSILKSFSSVLNASDVQKLKVRLSIPMVLWAFAIAILKISNHFYYFNMNGINIQKYCTLTEYKRFSVCLKLKLLLIFQKKNYWPPLLYILQRCESWLILCQ